jgi:hypothetical protein
VGTATLLQNKRQQKGRQASLCRATSDTTLLQVVTFALVAGGAGLAYERFTGAIGPPANSVLPAHSIIGLIILILSILQVHHHATT